MHRLTQIAAGVVAGLLLVEAGFHIRDRGAFPHVQFYRADPVLGLRLEPGASQRISFSDNPVTSIQVNSEGLRGAELAPPAPGEIVVVGDSQVFGLGVEADETFSARLAARTGRPVVNAGVPTYGPPEYAEMARRMVVERAPATVVFTVNMVNDLFEWNTPNRLRHAEWDGWAVRVETAPASKFDFPGRRLLMQKSHAVFAARTLLARLDPNAHTRAGLPSEGTWSDLVNLGQQAADSTDSHSSNGANVDPAELERRLQAVPGALRDAVTEGRAEAQQRSPDDVLLDVTVGHPGDIIGTGNAEEARDLAVTARLMRQGVAYRTRLIEQLAVLELERNAEIRAVVDRGRSLERERQAAARSLLNRRTPLSVLHPELEQLRDFCEAAGVELVVLVLPIDVQVSAAEWDKYPQQEPVDMEPTLVLADDILADARALGLRAVDARAALVDAEPGAFLYGDIHLSARGHVAVADALGAALSEPAPARLPTAGFADDRTWLPRQDDWLRTPEALVRGSTRARCETVRIEEWLRVTCLRIDGRRPSGVSGVRGDRGESRVVVSEEAVTLITPLFVGEPFRATFHWEQYGQVLSGTWADDGTVSLGFGERRSEAAEPLYVTPDETRLCDCYKAVREESSCNQHGDPGAVFGRSGRFSWVDDCAPSCAQMSGGNLAACSATHPVDCQAYLDCVEGQLHALVRCPDGQVPVGGGGRCMALCSEAEPCDDGASCTPWQGTQVCR